jgi:hypothetical protein
MRIYTIGAASAALVITFALLPAAIQGHHAAAGPYEQKFPEMLFNPARMAVALLRADIGPFPVSGLLLNADVQKELSLAPDQIEKINALVKQMGAAIDSLEKKDIAKIRAIGDKGAKGAIDLLTEKQLKRMQQIYLQYEGPSAFFAKEIVQKLKLTDEQNVRVLAAYNEGRKEVTLAVLREKKKKDSRLREFNAACFAKIMTILTEQQRREYMALVGESFHGTLPFAFRSVRRAEPKKE